MTEEKEIATESNGEENKAQDDVEDATDLELAIIRQVEYYFGDLNLPRDKFLKEQVKLDDGWIPLDVLLRFNRLQKLSTDIDVIVKALNKSTSCLLEVSEDNKKVRRSPEMPVPEMNEDRRKELSSRTIYAKGFPKDSTLDDILKHFKQFEEVENIIMRRYLDRATKKRLFKGSVFVTFKTKEQAEKFESTKGHKYDDKDLLILWQDQYIQQKQEEYANRKDKKDKKSKDKEKAQVEKEELALPKGTVLYFGEGSDKMTRENIKDAITPLGGEVAYIDFKVGDKEGWVRFAKENAAKEMIDKVTDGKIKICDVDVAFKLIEGDEEKTYLDRTVDEMMKRRRNMKNNRYNNKGKNFRGHQDRKRKGNNQDGGPRAKVKADS